jgi:hypothetical protein
MNHAITIGGLLLSVCVFVGIVMAAVGALMVFAGGMSDAPASGEEFSGQGCRIVIVGIAIIGGGLWALFA